MKKMSISMAESIHIEDIATEIFNEVYAKREGEILAEFRKITKMKLKDLLPTGSKIRISKIQTFEVKGTLRTESLHKDTYKRSVYTMLVPHTTF
jgi:hypothetical protein